MTGLVKECPIKESPIKESPVKENLLGQGRLSMSVKTICSCNTRRMTQLHHLSDTNH